MTERLGPGGAWERFTRWWTDDLPPLSGRQRFWFYWVLLALALASDGSPLRAATTYAYTDPMLRLPEPLVAALGLSDLGGATVIALRNAALVTWVCAAIGFVTRPAMVATGVLVAVLHGLSRGVMGVDHRWYLATYALLLLCLSAGDGRFSLDGWLARRVRWWPDFAASRSAVLRSGFARKLVLLAAVHTLFSAGVAKLLDGGFAWGDGVPIRNYILTSLDAMEGLGFPRGRWPALAAFVVAHPALCRVLATATLLLELGAPLMLFFPRLRLPMLVGAAGFHIGIWFTMIPSYWVQIWCYTLAVDWAAVRAWLRRGRRAVPARAAPPDRPPRWPSVLATALTAVLVFVAFARVESWPLTHIPMYASYLGADRVSELPIEDFDSREDLAAIARRCLDHACPWAAMIPTLARTEVRLRSGTATRDVTSELGHPHVPHWYMVLYRTVWQYYAYDPTSAEAEAAVRRAERMLERGRAQLTRQGIWIHDYDSLELVYAFAGVPEVVASVPTVPRRRDGSR